MIETASANGSMPGRANVAGLATPHPLGGYLPALYQDDDFAQRFTSGLDGVLAPIFSSLDNLEAYLDPRLAPADFLDWLGTWMGLVVDETWPIQRRRAFVSQASALYKVRGTPRGLAEHVRIFTGGEVEILERGGVAVSKVSGGSLPGSPGFELIVRVRVDDPTSVDTARLDALVAAAKPAHLVHKVEVVAAQRTTPTRRAVRATPAEPKPEAPPEPGSESPPESDGAGAGGDGPPPDQPSE